MLNTKYVLDTTVTSEIEQSLLIIIWVTDYLDYEIIIVGNVFSKNLISSHVYVTKQFISVISD